MDEPLSNLDAKLRNQMRAELIELREKVDTTFIYVTHDQVEAMTLGDRIVIMRDGVIQQVGTPQEVFGHPANLFVAGFIGSPQMNFFADSKLTRSGDAYTIEIMGEKAPLTPEQNAALKAAGVDDCTVTVGVRPVHMVVGDKGLPATIEVSELMGSELHLHLSLEAAQNVVAVVPTANLAADAYARHSSTHISFDPRLIHLFDPATEKNLI
jgi:multiple sugar transport system ATP-binding protein